MTSETASDLMNSSKLFSSAHYTEQIGIHVINVSVHKHKNTKTNWLDIEGGGEGGTTKYARARIRAGTVSPGNDVKHVQ